MIKTYRLKQFIDSLIASLILVGGGLCDEIRMASLVLNNEFEIPDIYTSIMTFQNNKLTTNCKKVVIDSIHIAEGYTWEITWPTTSGCEVTTSNIICEGIIELYKGSDLIILRQGTVTGKIDIIRAGSINITEGAKFEISGDGKIVTSSNGSNIKISGKLNIIDKGILDTKHDVKVHQTGILNIDGDGVWKYNPGNRIIDGTLSISKPENLVPLNENRHINLNGTLILPQQNEEAEETRKIILGSDAKVYFYSVYSVGVVGNEIKYIPTIDHGLTFLNEQNEEIEPEITVIPPTLTYISKNPTLNKPGYILDISQSWLNPIIESPISIEFDILIPGGYVMDFDKDVTGSGRIIVKKGGSFYGKGKSLSKTIINQGTLVFK